MCGFLVDSYSNVFFVKFCWFGSSWFVIKLQIQFTEKKSLVPNQSHWVSTQKLRVLQFSWSTTAQKINMLHLNITQLERKIIFSSLHFRVQLMWIFQGDFACRNFDISISVDGLHLENDEGRGTQDTPLGPGVESPRILDE